MSKNPTTLLPYIDLVKSQIQCGYNEQALDLIESIGKDLKDFLEECKQGDDDIG